MSSGIYFYIGGYHHVVTDNDIVIIEERAVHVHDHLVPEIDVFPILASEVYVDVNILADTSEHLPIDALLCLIVGIIRSLLLRTVISVISGDEPSKGSSSIHF